MSKLVGGSSRNPPKRLRNELKERLSRLISGGLFVLKQTIKTSERFSFSFSFTPQVDVSGNCSSEYKIVKSKQSESEIIKTRNLSNCSKRSHNVTKLNPVMYGVSSVS